MNKENEFEKLAQYENEIAFLHKQLDTVMLEYDKLKSRINFDNQFRSSFYSKLSHEIRTPMNSLSGYSDLLIMESKDDKILSFAKSIKSSTNRLLNTFSNLMDLYNIESGLTHLNNQEYSAETLIKTLIHDARLETNLKNLELQVHIKGNIPSCLFGDFTHVRQAINNLIMYSIQSTSNGYIYIEISADTRNRDACLNILIKDTGTGMKPEERNKLRATLSDLNIQSSFTNTDSDFSLIVTKYFCKMMNGDLSFMSKYGQGTSYICTLHQTITDESPLSEDFISSIEDGSDKKLSAPNAKVLIVDDSRVNLSVALNLLKFHDIKAETSANGYQAIKMVEGNKYDLVFMDHMMPDIDGIETTERIRSLKGSYFKSLPIIALTANATDDARQLFMEHNFSDYMSKPINKAILSDMLYKWLPKSKISLKDKTDNNDTFHNKYTLAFEKAGISIDDGLTYTGGNMDMYMSILKTLSSEYDNYVLNLTTSLENNDLANYGIYIHSVKGALASIGATTLSNFAKELELKAKSGDGVFVHGNADEMLVRFSTLINAIRKIIESYDTDNMTDDEDLKEQIPEENICHNLLTVKDFINDYEIDKAMEIINSLRKYALPHKVYELLKKLENLIDDFEYDEAIEEIDEYVIHNIK